MTHDTFNTSPREIAQAPKLKLEAEISSGSDIRVYEYGVRLDHESAQAAHEQIFKARRLYNDIIAAIRGIFDEMQAFVLAHAGDEARSIHAQVLALNESFDQARAANDEPAMKEIASRRRLAWRELSELLASTRKQLAPELREQFYTRIGNNSSTLTYQLRCKAVDEGLGWGTATRVLDRALIAYKSSIKLGRAPQFARADEILQDSLTLQFTAAGGVAVERLMDGSHGELRLRASGPAAPRSYGDLEFRLGAAKAGVYARGTWQYHRPVPVGAAVASATLVRRRVANKFKWAVQLTLRDPSLRQRQASPQRTLVAIHMGWALDDNGRQVAGIADAADPGLARMLHLPDDIEASLAMAQEIQAGRDLARDGAVGALKWIDASVIAGLDEQGASFFAGLKPLRAQHIAAKKFYAAQLILRRADVQLEWLDKWVADDRKAWQATVGISRRARARRKEFYRTQADQLARQHSAVLIETLDLAKAAQKIDTKTGERSEFSAAARRGRHVAALYEFDLLIGQACAKYGTALFRLEGAATVSECAVCGDAHVTPVADTAQELRCPSCGARGPRKLMGAARAWQIGAVGIEARILDFHSAQSAAREGAAAAKAEKSAKMALGRQLARERRDQANANARTSNEASSP